MVRRRPLSPLLVCLDFDGCLVDSRAAITTAIGHTLRARGLDVRHGDLERCIGPPLVESFTWLLSEQGADTADAAQCVEIHREVYPALAAELTTVVDGMPRVLDVLAKQATVVVVTSKPAAFTRPLLDLLDLGRYLAGTFAPALNALDEVKGATLSRALEAFAPEAAVMVGDRWHDVAAGEACGARTIGVTWGVGSADELRNAGADIVIDEPHDLPEAAVSLLRGARSW